MDVTIPALAAHITDEASAYEFLERLRWEGRPVCPHCGSVRKPYFLKPRNGESRKTRTGASSQRRVWKCADCRKQFSVLTGTIFHGTKIPLKTWLFVVYEMCASKNGVAAREIERKYGLTPKSAWFMVHRIREAMKREPLASMLKGAVVADETWIGGKPSNRHGHKRGKRGQGVTDKTPVVSLIDKQTGEVRSVAVTDVTGANLRKVIGEQVDVANTTLHTDSAAAYRKIAPEFLGHESVDHSAGEYVRGRGQHQHGGELLQPAEAVHRRHAPPRLEGAPAPLLGRVRLPVLDTGPEGRRAHGAGYGEHGWAAADLQAPSVQPGVARSGPSVPH